MQASRDYEGMNTAAARQTQVCEEIERLERLIDEQYKLHAQLSQRLAPILRNEPPQNDGQKMLKEINSLVPLAERIHAANARLQELSNQYGKLMSLIEL